MTRTDRLALATFAVALLLAAAPASAKDETCTDGTSCLCDKIAQTDPGVVFCEDFERSVLDQDGTGSGWVDTYGGPVDGCWQKGLPTGEWVKSVEGTCPTCCVNVVKETTCEVPGQADCVFQGSRSLGHRYHPGATQGIVGSKGFSRGTNFGVTMAVKYSKNFVVAAVPKKTNEFGPINNCLFGCSGGTYVSHASGMPFHGNVYWQPGAAAPTWRAVVGKGGYSGVAFGWYPNVPAEYDFNRDHGLDSWHCWRFHMTNVGQTGAKVRQWMDDKLLVQIEDVDLRNMQQASAGFDSISFNNYYNEGYPGSSIAYRYEDNIVVTTSSEPVSCQAIGFSSGSPGTQLGVPGQPKLIP
ncbi:MAG: hypothetical protein IT386_10395 [Deltaproteobacteria bacterium]|nr:hypothetical protein [Deltaproteobacteria bacterium]